MHLARCRRLPMPFTLHSLARAVRRALAILVGAAATGTAPAAAADSLAFTPLRCPAAQSTATTSGSETDLCHCLSQQLPGRLLDGAQAEAVSACARALPLGALGALGALGRSRLVVLPAYLELAERPPSHAAFLMQRQGGAWQVADMVLSPTWTHGGPCEVQASARPAKAAGRPRLRLQLQRRCQQPLDPSEVRAGAPSLAVLQCHTLLYAVDPQGLQPVQAHLVERACAAR